MKWTSKLSRRLLLVCFLVLMLASLSQAVRYFNQGANRASLLADEAQLFEEGPPVSFTLDKLVAKDQQAFIFKRIAQQYSKAINQLNLFYVTRDFSLIEDGFTAEQKNKITNLANNTPLNNAFKSQFIGHHLEFNFLSMDKKIVSFTDQRALKITSQSISKKDTKVIAKDQISTAVIMFFQDGFWRIAHWEQVTLEAYNYSQKHYSEGIRPLNGINYYPKEFPWDTFNPLLNLDIINQDFNKVRQLGFNGIRIFLDYSDMGAAYPDTKKLQRLKTILDLAQKKELQVVVTLFDFYGDYRLATWPAVTRHVNALVKHIGEHPAIHSWDLKNEPDLDYQNRGQNRVQDWLEFVANQMRVLGVKQPLTIGWSNAQTAIPLEKTTDYLSFHYYQKPEDLITTIDILKQNSNQPIFLQEFGLSSYRGIWAPFGNSKKDQLKHYQLIQEAVNQQNISSFCWTLYDFKEVPKKVSSWKPWIQKKQANFGLLDVTGAEKPVCKLFK